MASVSTIRQFVINSLHTFYERLKLIFDNRYLPRSGGTMNDDSSIDFVETSEQNNTSISGYGVEINKEPYHALLEKNDLHFWDDQDSSTKYSIGNIINNDYTLSLPNKSGTVALTSDIPTLDSTPTSGSTNGVTSGGTYTAIQNAIGSVYRVKGSKATYANLPSSGNVTGDVWNVEAAYGDYPPGTNWVWNGTAWDALGGTIDLSAYQTTATADSKYVTALGTSGNNLTWTKNGTTNNITVPFATKASQDEDGNSISQKYLKYEKIIFPTSPFADGSYVLSTQLNNAFYALHKRKTITFSGFSGTPVASQLFDNDYSSVGSNYIAAGGTGVITIGSTEDAIFTTYTYGTLLLSFYVESTKAAPKSVSIRAYGTKGGVTGWHNFNAAQNYSGPYGTINSLISAYNGNIYNIRCWEITIEADDNLPCYVCEIMNIFTRSNGEGDQSVVTKYANAQTLYGAITIDNTFSTTGKATLNSLEVTNASTLKGAATLNGGAAIKGAGNAVTNINGASASVDYSHIFVTGGSSNTRPLVLQNGYGNVGIGVTAPTQKLEVDGNVKATSFIKSGGTSSQFLKADGSVDSNTYALASEIPDAQIQSDWNQTTTTAKDYIKNKPNVVNNGNGVVGINNSTFAAGIVNISDSKNSISLNGASDDGILITTNNGSDGRISLTASSNIELNTSGTNKAYYNNEEIATKGDIKPALPIPFGAVDSSSTATVITATVNNFPNTLTDGVCAYIRNDVIDSASGWTLNINGTGALPVYASNADASRTTTIFTATTTYLFVYNSSRVSGGCWDIYYGYDSNTNTIGYQIRTNSYSLPMKSIVYRYRLLFTSADGKYFVPANYSSSTDATTARTVCQDPIDPFGAIVYYGTTTSVAAGSRPEAANLWSQYAITLGYSFNRTGAALTLTPWKPVYIKCGPQDDGSAIIDLYTPYVQALPTSEDGKIYIFLGVAYNATSIELNNNHPVYFYKEGAIRPWVNATDAALSSSDIRGIWSDVFGAVLISFTINGTTYQAEEGMTWREWTESEYNTGEYECVEQNVVAPVFGAPPVHDVNATDVIVDGRAYTHNTVGGGSND